MSVNLHSVRMSIVALVYWVHIVSIESDRYYLNLRHRDKDY